MAKTRLTPPNPRTTCQICGFTSDHMLANVRGRETYCPSCGELQTLALQLAIDVLRAPARERR